MAFSEREREREREMIELKRRDSKDVVSSETYLKKEERDVTFTVDEAIESVSFGKYQCWLILFIGSIWSTLFNALRSETHTHTHTYSCRCNGNYAYEFSFANSSMSLESELIRGSFDIHGRVRWNASRRTFLGVRR